MTVGFVLNFAIYFIAALSFSRIQNQRSIDEVAKFAMTMAQDLTTSFFAERVITGIVLYDYHVQNVPFSIPIPSKHSLFRTVDVRHFENGSEPTLLYSERAVRDIPSDIINRKQSAVFSRWERPQNMLTSVIMSEIRYALVPLLPVETKGSYVFSYEWQFKDLLKDLSANSMTLTLIEFDSKYNYDLLYSDLQKEDNEALVKATSYMNDEIYLDIYKSGDSNRGYQNVKMITLSNTKHLLYPIALSDSTTIRQLIYYALPLPNYRAIDKTSVFLLLVATFIATLGGLVLGLSKTN